MPLWLALLVAVLLLILLGWQGVALSRAAAALEAESQAMSRQFEADRSALLNDLRARSESDADAAQRRFGMALAWAVRGEVIRNNLDQVDQFFGELVRLPGTERVLLADAAGTVRVSTDRRISAPR